MCSLLHQSSVRPYVLYFSPQLDPELSSLADNSPVGAMYVEGGPADLSISADVSNVAPAVSGNAILPVSNTSVNYEFHCFFSDVDVAAGQPDSLGLPTAVAAADDVTVIQSRLDPGQSISVGLSASLSIPSGSCADIQCLCCYFTEGAGASYVDRDLGNDDFCLDMSSKIACVPGEKLNWRGLNATKIIQRDSSVW